VGGAAAMLTWDRWQFPDHEAHLPRRMRKFNLRVAGLDGQPRHTYQYPLYQQALKATALRRVAVDVGAHVGLFSYWMVRDFAQVIAFEPVAEHRRCWEANVPARPVDVLYPCALGATVGSVGLTTPLGSSGGTHISGAGDVPIQPLDTFLVPVIDLLKVDCEGYELEVLRGAEATLRHCHPTICVEQRARTTAAAGHGPADAVKWLARLGASVVWTDKSDYILAWGRR